MEISAMEIVEGNKEVGGVVRVKGWKDINQSLVKNKLVMAEEPDSIVIAKCVALGAGGLIIRNDAKIQVSTTKIVVDDVSWEKLLELKIENNKIWIDEANLKLVINK